MATDHYQLRVIGLHQTQYNECVLHFKGENLTAANYMENAEDLALAWENAIMGLWLDCLPASYCLFRLAAKKFSLGGGGEFVTQFQNQIQVGAVAGGAASQQLCPAIRLIPPIGVKTAGRVFMPCIAESQIAANAPNATWVTNISTLFTDMMAGFANSSIDWFLEIYSRKNNTYADVMDFDNSPLVGFQRRRQRMNL